jgi:hypothetical protein
MISSLRKSGAMRQCPYCGKGVVRDKVQCPACREALPQTHVAARRPGERREIRRGLIYMLLAAVIHYFAGSYSPMTLPVSISPLVTTYLSPLLFLGGLGMTVYGYFISSKV